MATQRNAVCQHHRTTDLGWPHHGHCIMCDLPSLQLLLLGIAPLVVPSYAVSVCPHSFCSAGYGARALVHVRETLC